jgi:CRISPR system Cascade subunit CasE
MPLEAPPLFMLQLDLDLAGLARLGRERRLPPGQEDSGYLVHCALGELFGERAPKPFALDGERHRHMRVLGYASVDGDALRAEADALASPGVHSLVDWRALATKPMPSNWPAGTRLGFQLRACPVVRMASAGARHRKGAEVDAFLARCWEVGEGVPVDRQEVYSGWLRDQLDRRGGAVLTDVRVESFKRLRLVRRTHESEGRRSRLAERPDVLFRGALEVTDPTAFAALLARGVGRHRAFGFGMILLRRS